MGHVPWVDSVMCSTLLLGHLSVPLTVPLVAEAMLEGNFSAFSDNFSDKISLSLLAFVGIYSSNLPKSNPKPTAASSKPVR